MAIWIEHFGIICWSIDSKWYWRAQEKKERDTLIRASFKNHQSRQITSQSNRANLSTSTSRLNEPLPTGRRNTRASRASRGIPLTGKNYVVDQAEREAWVVLNYL